MAPPSRSARPSTLRSAGASTTTGGSALYGPLLGKYGDAPSLTMLAYSAPNAMLADRDGSAGGASMVSTTFEPKSQLTCTVQVWFEEITANTEVMSFVIGNKVAAFWVEPLDATSISSALLYDRVGPKIVKGPNLPLEQWIQISLGGQLAQSGFFLGAYAQDASMIADFRDADANLFAVAPVFAVGAFNQTPAKSNVRIDDVRCLRSVTTTDAARRRDVAERVGGSMPLR